MKRLALLVVFAVGCSSSSGDGGFSGDAGASDATTELDAAATAIADGASPGSPAGDASSVTRDAGNVQSDSGGLDAADAQPENLDPICNITQAAYATPTGPFGPFAPVAPFTITCTSPILEPYGALAWDPIGDAGTFGGSQSCGPDTVPSKPCQSGSPCSAEVYVYADAYPDGGGSYVTGVYQYLGTCE